jgi:hypothetical protein
MVTPSSGVACGPTHFQQVELRGDLKQRTCVFRKQVHGPDIATGEADAHPARRGSQLLGPAAERA